MVTEINKVKKRKLLLLISSGVTIFIVLPLLALLLFLMPKGATIDANIVGSGEIEIYEKGENGEYSLLSTIDKNTSFKQDKDETLKFVAKESHNWVFGGIYVNGVLVIDSNQSYEIQVEESASIEARFTEIVEFDVTINSSGEGEAYANQVGGDIDFIANKGQTVMFFALPEAGYKLAYWTINGEIYLKNDKIYKNNNLIFDVYDKIDVVANFSLLEEFMISVNVLGEGTAHATISGVNQNYFQVTEYDMVDFECQNTDNDYKFSHWMIDGIDDYTTKGKNIVTFEMTDDHTITAVFILKNSYDVFVISEGNGSAFADYDGERTAFIAKEGDKVTFVAEAEYGYKFICFEIDGEYFCNDVTFEHEIVESIVITAIFENSKQFETEFKVNGFGYLDVKNNTNDTSFVVKSNKASSKDTFENDSLTLTASTNIAGYKFSHFETDGKFYSSNAIVNYSVLSSQTITAVFVPLEKFIVKIEFEGQGTAYAEGYEGLTEFKITEGEEVTFVAKSSVKGYAFTSWQKNGVDVSFKASFQTQIQSNVIYTVCFFELPSYNVAIESTTGGSVTATYDNNIVKSFKGYANDTLNLVAKADRGYAFSHFEKNDVKHTEFATFKEILPFSFSLTNIVYTAVFVKLDEIYVNIVADEGSEVSFTFNNQDYKTNNITLMGYVGESLVLSYELLDYTLYTFNGWKNGENISQRSTYNYAFKEDTTITALVYKEFVEVQLEKDSGIKKVDVLDEFGLTYVYKIYKNKAYVKNGDTLHFDVVAFDAYSFDFAKNTNGILSTETSFDVAVSDIAYASTINFATTKKPTFVVCATINNANFGSVFINEQGQDKYMAYDGEEITVIAVAKQDYKFREFAIGENKYTNSTIKISAKENMQISATFNDLEYFTITLLESKNGTYDVYSGENLLAFGDNTLREDSILTVVTYADVYAAHNPFEQYYFQHLLVNDEIFEMQNNTLTVLKDMTILPVFEEVAYYEITLTQTDGGTISIDENTVGIVKRDDGLFIYENAKFEIIANANDGYFTNYWFKNNHSVTSSGEFTEQGNLLDTSVANASYYTVFSVDVMGAIDRILAAAQNNYGEFMTLDMEEIFAFETYLSFVINTGNEFADLYKYYTLHIAANVDLSGDNYSDALIEILEYNGADYTTLFAVMYTEDTEYTTTANLSVFMGDVNFTVSIPRVGIILNVVDAFVGGEIVLESNYLYEKGEDWNLKDLVGDDMIYSVVEMLFSSMLGALNGASYESDYVEIRISISEILNNAANLLDGLSLDGLNEIVGAINAIVSAQGDDFAELEIVVGVDFETKNDLEFICGANFSISTADKFIVPLGTLLNMFGIEGDVKELLGDLSSSIGINLNMTLRDVLADLNLGVDFDSVLDILAAVIDFDKLDKSILDYSIADIMALAKIKGDVGDLEIVVPQGKISLLIEDFDYFNNGTRVDVEPSVLFDAVKDWLNFSVTGSIYVPEGNSDVITKSGVPLTSKDVGGGHTSYALADANYSKYTYQDAYYDVEILADLNPWALLPAITYDGIDLSLIEFDDLGFLSVEVTKFTGQANGTYATKDLLKLLFDTEKMGDALSLYIDFEDIYLFGQEEWKDNSKYHPLEFKTYKFRTLEELYTASANIDIDTTYSVSGLLDILPDVVSALGFDLGLDSQKPYLLSWSSLGLDINDSDAAQNSEDGNNKTSSAIVALNNNQSFSSANAFAANAPIQMQSQNSESDLVDGEEKSLLQTLLNLGTSVLDCFENKAQFGSILDILNQVNDMFDGKTTLGALLGNLLFDENDETKNSYYKKDTNELIFDMTSLKQSLNIVFDEPIDASVFVIENINFYAAIFGNADYLSLTLDNLVMDSVTDDIKNAKRDALGTKKVGIKDETKTINLGGKYGDDEAANAALDAQILSSIFTGASGTSFERQGTYYDVDGKSYNKKHTVEKYYISERYYDGSVKTITVVGEEIYQGTVISDDMLKVFEGVLNGSAGLGDYIDLLVNLNDFPKDVKAILSYIVNTSYSSLAFMVGGLGENPYVIGEEGLNSILTLMSQLSTVFDFGDLDLSKIPYGLYSYDINVDYAN